MCVNSCGHGAAMERGRDVTRPACPRCHLSSVQFHSRCTSRCANKHADNSIWCQTYEQPPGNTGTQHGCEQVCPCSLRTALQCCRLEAKCGTGGWNGCEQRRLCYPTAALDLACSRYTDTLACDATYWGLEQICEQTYPRLMLPDVMILNLFYIIKSGVRN